MMTTEKDILLTGHSGFLGRYILQALQVRHKMVIRLGRKTGEIVCDLAEHIPDLSAYAIGTVVHAAGQAHNEPKTATERDRFFAINRTGTAHLLAALDQLSMCPRLFIYISTVAVYGRVNGESIREDEPLHAVSPYGMSKIEAEELIQDWCQRVGCHCLLLRLPLIVGENAPGNLASMQNGIRRGYYLRLGRGLARRSMVRADDVARLIADLPLSDGVFNLTDGYHPQVAELEIAMAAQLQKQVRKIPFWLARGLALTGDLVNPLLGGRFPLTSTALAKLTQSLTFDDSKARRELGWQPQPVLTFFR
jgi:nucleoside-diphosphate-sugar epimerase